MWPSAEKSPVNRGYNNYVAMDSVSMAIKRLLGKKLVLFYSYAKTFKPQTISSTTLRVNTECIIILIQVSSE